MSGLCLYVSPLSGCLVFVWMSQLYRHIWPLSGYVTFVLFGWITFIWMSHLYVASLTPVWMSFQCLEVWYFLDFWSLSGRLVFIWMFDLCLDVWPLPGCLDFLWMGLFLGNWPLSLCLIFVWNVSTLFTCMFVLCLDVLSLSDVWPLSECFNFIFDWIFYLCMNYWPLSWCLVFVWMSDLCLDVWPLSGCLHDLCLDVWPLSGCLDILWFEFQMSRSSNFIREKCVDRC